MIVEHRIGCAAFAAKGCLSDIGWVDQTPGEEISAIGLKKLQEAGWWLDHGKWVCSNHLRGQIDLRPDELPKLFTIEGVGDFYGNFELAGEKDELRRWRAEVHVTDYKLGDVLMKRRADRQSITLQIHLVSGLTDGITVEGEAHLYSVDSLPSGWRFRFIGDGPLRTR